MFSEENGKLAPIKKMESSKLLNTNTFGYLEVVFGGKDV